MALIFKENQVVRIEGVEPPRREALEPKSSVSTNSTISARCLVKRV